MRPSRWIVAVPALLAACSPAGETPVAGDAYIRLAAVPGRPSAAYFTLHGGATDMTLVQVEVPGATRVELHNSRTTADGMVAMDAIPGVDLRSRGTVTFAPGAQHAMLYGLPATVKPGATVPLTLRFGDGSAIRADARVIAAGEAVPGA